ncbi:MAG TPA: pitrilysin family protein [Sphingomicrobium sp.]|nr:pitrilysin family protein [Sphingomicrobium sp.]
MNFASGALRALMVSASLLVVCASPAALAAPVRQSSVTADPLKQLNIDIPATTFVLPNGLTLVVHEDHSAPLVAVNIWYHVGSKNEPQGKSGFAHLFEHLMFNGSENFNDDFFKATQRIGATSQNGTTSWDRTNYYQTVPKAALDSILWLESDRMGHLLGAIDKAKLDEQRSVVKNEKRQGDNRPYAKAWDLIIRATTPVGHPYAHSTIGSMEDLEAASLEDVQEWFKTYYGPSNAVLVLSGDITPQEAKAKVEKYFGDIAPGTPVSQPKSWIVQIPATIRETAYDRVAQPRLYQVWNISDYSSSDTDYLQFLSYLLAGDKNARLYKRLVLDDQFATAVSAEVMNREIGGQFLITAAAKPGQNLSTIEAIVDEELGKLLKSGPTAAEMARIRTSTLASYVRSLESISTKAAVLAESQTYLGDANGWKPSFQRFRDATPAQVKDAGARWLKGGSYILNILPFGDLTAAAVGADRSAMPMPGSAVPASFPAVERSTLANGLKLVVARRTGVPVVNFTTLFDTGTAPDFANLSPALGSVALNMLDEATTSRSGEQLVSELASVGATLQTGGGGETSTVSLSALKSTIPSALKLYADVILNPAIRQEDLDRIKAQSVAGIASRKQDPSQLAGRLLPKLLFGDNHAYGRITNEASVNALGRDNLRSFHARWFAPNNATLIVTGDTSLAEVKPLVEKAFASWKAGGKTQTIAPTSSGPDRPIVYLVDKPGTPQTVIKAAVVAPPRSEGDEIARKAFNTAFGGSFTSRLNMKLREEKGWAYGASSGITGGRGSQLFSAGASVQADKTAESMSEISAALKAILSDRKVDAAELAAAKDSMILGLSSAWSTANGIGQYVADQAVYRLGDDYYGRYTHLVTAQTPGNVNAAAAEVLANRPITWLIVGDRSKIEGPIRALGLGEVRVIDADGNPVR